MEIGINAGFTKKDVQDLVAFLKCIAVNKGLFWALHLNGHLKRMQQLGIQSWQSTIANQDLKPISKKWKQKHGKANFGFGVYSGQTANQAKFQEGYAEIEKTQTGIKTAIISPEWMPAEGEGRWKSKHDTDRPFWQYNGRFKFFNLYKYVNIDPSNLNIWKSSTNGSFGLDDARKQLIMPESQVQEILDKKQFKLGSWTKGQLNGVASKWR